MTNVQLHPTLGAAIASVVNTRCLAAEMICRVLYAKPYSPENFAFWRTEHIEATQKLAAMGITLPTYVGEP